MPLNLDFLRTLARNAKPADGSSQRGMTRRQMLTISAVAAAGAGDVLKAFERNSLFELRATKERVAFVLDGVERFVLDCSTFAGAPRLTCSQSRNRFVVELSGGRFPGTTLPADLRITGRRALGWRMFVRMPALGFATEASLESWLRGEETAAGSAAARRRICMFRSGGVWLRGRGTAMLTTAGVSLTAPSIARARVERRTFRADTISLAFNDTTSRLLDIAGARSVLELRRGEQQWPDFLPEQGEDSWRLERSDAPPFDVMFVEAAEEGNERQHAVLFRSNADAAPLRFLPGDLTGEDGAPFAMPLHDLRYGVDPDMKPATATLLASLGDPVTAISDGFALRMGRSTEAAGNEFSLRLCDGKISCLDCRPGVAAVSVVTPHAIVQTTRLPDCCTLPFSWGDVTDTLGSALSFDRHGEPQCSFTHFCSGILRPRDLVALELEFIGFKLVLSSRRPYVQKRSDDAVIVVHFPPQHIVEQAFYEMDEGDRHQAKTRHETPQPPPVQRRLSGPSRLAFTLKPEVQEIDYDVDALLDWTTWVPHVTESSQPKGTFKPIKGVCEPGTTVTAIEAPYRVILSPTSDMRWMPVKPTENDSHDHAELWHADLRPPEPTEKEKKAAAEESAKLHRPPPRGIPPATVRAVWTPDLTCNAGGCATPPKPGCLPFATAMLPNHRSQIVTLSADYEQTTTNDTPYFPVPIDTYFMYLSSLGASFDLKGEWDPLFIKPRAQCDLDVQSWKNRTFLGRDNYVEVVQIGFAFPPGHLIARIRETERKLQPRAEESGAPEVAYLRYREYVIAIEHRKTYPAFQQPYAGRATAFREIYFDPKRNRTPPLDNPDPIGETKPSQEGKLISHWPTVNGEPFFFGFGGVNVGRNVADTIFRLPIIFVTLKDAFDLKRLEVIRKEYLTKIERRRADIKGQKMTFAPEKKDGDGTLETGTFELDADLAAAGSQPLDFRKARQPMFYPNIAAADVRIPSVQQFTGSPAATRVVFPKTYLDNGFVEKAGNDVANAGEVFLAVAAEPPALSFPGGRSGGFAKPSVEISALSRLAGPIAGTIDKFASGLFDAIDFFDDLDDAKLLGVIRLGEVIQPIHDVRTQLDRVPKLILEQVRGVQNKIDGLRTQVRELVAKVSAEIAAKLKPLSDAVYQVEARVITDAVALENALQDKRDELLALYAESEKTVKEQIDEKRRAVADAKTDLEKHLEKQLTESKAFKTVQKTAEAISTVTELQSLIQETTVRTFPKLAEFDQTLENKIHSVAKANSAIVDPELVHELRIIFRVVEDVSQAKDDVLSLRNELIQTAQGMQAELEAIARHPIVTSFNALQDAVADAYAPNASPIDAAANVATAGMQFSDELFRAAQGEPYVSLRTRLSDARQRLEKKRAQFEAAWDARVAKMKSSLDTRAVLLGIVSEMTTFQSKADEVKSEVKAAVEPLLRFVDDAAATLAEVERTANDFKQAAESAIAVWRAEYELALAEITRPREIEVRYDIEPKVQSAPKSNPVFVCDPTDKRKTSFKIRSVIRKRVGFSEAVNSEPPSVTVEALLTNFDIVLFPFAKFLILEFNKLSFDSKNGERPKIEVEMGEVKFGEALEFVKALQSVLPFGNKGDGFFIDLSARGAMVGYRLGLPSVMVGAFNLHHMSISAAVELPFDGSPARVRFAFCERNRPFMLTMGIYGGGGFLAVTLQADKVERLEGSLEFGAFAELNLAVASGHAHVLAGIYFSTDSQTSRLTGFVHAGGEFRVIGMINMSIEFYMGVTREGNHVTGEAVVKVSIDLFFDTIDVEVHCRREFSGGGGGAQDARRRSLPGDSIVLSMASSVLGNDPERCLDPDPLPTINEWQRYRRAFAPKVKDCK